MRLFFAFGVPSSENERVQGAVDALAPQLPSARWVDPANRHVTVRFLGSVSEDAVSDVASAARRVTSELSPSEISIGRIGAFPRMSVARVLWAGIEDRDGCAAALFDGLERDLGLLGWPPEERGYTPHLTIARFKTPVAIPSATEALLPPGPGFLLEELLLFESTLTPKGARYEVKETFPLGSPS